MAELLRKSTNKQRKESFITSINQDDDDIFGFLNNVQQEVNTEN